MTCPKCKAKIGITSQQIILDTGVVNGSRCIICGYLEIDHSVRHAPKQLRGKK
ncbi:MAG TPA: MJ0042-type zinc finger domain-containing protein [Desulfuromonadaceae bacterium]